MCASSCAITSAARLRSAATRSPGRAAAASRGRRPRRRSPSRRPRSRARRPGRAWRTGTGCRSSPRDAPAPRRRPRARTPSGAPCPGRARRGSASCPTWRAALASSGPTASAKRYVESGGVGPKWTMRRPSCSGSSRSIGAFDEHRVRLGRGHGDAEARLERRLVEAREDAARVGRLALREGVARVAGARGVEAAQMLVQRAGEAQARARRRRPAAAGQRAASPSRRAVEAHAQRDHLAVDLGVGVLDRQVGRVQDDLRSGRARGGRRCAPRPGSGPPSRSGSRWRS